MRFTKTLEVTTPSDREIVLTRSFEAPAQLVFDALTKPELVKRWLHGWDDWTMPVCEIDLRVGGKYRYVWAGPNGEKMGMGGVYREIEAPTRIVNTEKFDEPWYPGEAVGTTILEEENRKTTLTTTMLYDSKEIRDGVLQSGMEEGVAVSYDRLEKLVVAEA
jgi:uncharacterized protein YndB with AHSA1/START domain